MRDGSEIRLRHGFVAPGDAITLHSETPIGSIYLDGPYREHRVPMGATLRTLNRITKPGGSVLITTAGIAKVGRRLGRDDWGEYWRHTAQGLGAQVKEFFPGAEADIVTYGNVLAATAFLHGLASDELEQSELDYVDEDFEVIVAARVTPR